MVSEAKNLSDVKTFLYKSFNMAVKDFEDLQPSLNGATAEYRVKHRADSFKTMSALAESIAVVEREQRESQAVLLQNSYKKAVGKIRKP